MSKGKLFVISGASGVGKSTVLKAVMQCRDDLTFSVSATTRDPRPEEREGVHYYFVSEQTFQGMIDAGEFLEYNGHMNHRYGTPRGQLVEKLERSNVILDIEPNGAFAVRKERPDAVLIFIMPPSMEELRRRLEKRQDTPQEEVELRLERAKWEIAQSPKYDYVVVNDEADRCAAEVLHIIADQADN